ncbi:uncharacterized protein LOC119326207 [Triticum dicoccoides]|uniref:uncharacterized protein LOC119326207 n=1 Tax=Triticum dicoccoides TaxID=85692 RepID=UPI001891AD54|nr:uncharacterized protein LOC119326207 [Triticum dicoccoides]
MGDNSKDKSVDSSVEKLCESMQRMLAQLMEQAQVKSSSSTEIQKSILEPNPVKLTGPGDYFSWARNASLILEAHGLHKYLSEDEKKPTDVVQEQWEQNQKRVMVWLLGSMEKTVREQVESFQTAAEVWTSIEKQFSGKSNKMQVSRILHEMWHFRQDQKSVTEYAGEFKKLYRDLEFFRPFKPHDPRDLSLLREWFEPLLVQGFLEGLNPEFKLRSQMIQASPDWPTLDQTIASILEEETRLANQEATPQMHGDNRAALTHAQTSVTSRSDQANTTKFDYRRRNKVVCDHCKMPGHVKKNCFELVGYPPGWKQRQTSRFNGSGNNFEKKQDRAHLTSSTKELPATAAHALEEFKAKLMAVATEGSSEAVGSRATEGFEVRKNSWDWN